MTTPVEIIVKATDHASSVLKGVSGSLKKFDDGLNDVVSGLTGMNVASLAGAGGVVMLAKGMQQSIDAASNMSETVNKARVVFGSAADQIITFGNSAAVGMGMSKQAAIEAAATFGNLFVSMDMSSGKTAEMSTGLVKLAGDLASFNNIDPGVALEKLRAGIVGETEPLRTLGVNISEAAVKAKALQLGLGGVSGELTAAEKVTARYALIMEQTATAQGDFARTSDGLANQMRILKAQQEDLAANAGTTFLPAYLKVVQTLNEAVKAFGLLTSAADKVSTAVQENAKNALKSSSTYAEYTARIEQANKTAWWFGTTVEALTEDQYNAARSADAVKSSLDGLTSTNYTAAESTSYAAVASDDLAESLRGVHSAVSDTGMYAQMAKDAYDGLTQATNDLAAAQKSFAESTAGDAASALQEAGLKGDKYKEALGLVDEAMGTQLKTQQEYKDQLAAAAKAYASGALSGEAYKAKLMEIKDTYAPFNEAIQKANEQVQKFLDLIDSIPSVKYTVVRVINESTDQAYTGTKVNASGSGGREVYASGGSFVIPPGYPNDSYPIGPGKWAQSGERVTITPPGKSGGTGNTVYNLNINLPSVTNARQFANELGKITRSATNAGAGYAGM